MKKLLVGKKALITGGGRGIGKAIALEFAKNGADIAVTALEREELEKTVKDIENFNVKGLSLPADLSNLDNLKNVVDRYYEKFSKCDILVNNAGMSYYCPLLDVSLEKAIKLFNLNLIAYYAMIKLVLPKMVEQKSGGNIIMTASVHGNMFFNANQVAYSATKAGVSAMGKCLHNELKPFDIQVNVVLPGAIQTKLFEDSAARGQLTPDPILPEKIAPVYLFLASNLSKHKYTGKIINQYLLYELLPKVRRKIMSSDFEIKEITVRMKSSLRKNDHELLRKNQELIDFLLRYHI